MPRPSVSLKESEDYKKQKRADAIKIATWSMMLPPINNDDAEQVKDRIMLYFNYCAENSYIIGLEGLCNALKITTSTFRSWLDGSARKGQDHQKLCQEAEQVIKAYMEGEMLTGDIQPVTGIFIMSNLHGYVQKSTVQTEVKSSIIDTATPEQLAKRYAEGSIIDVAFEESKPRKQLAESSNVQKAENLQIQAEKEKEIA